MPNRRAILSHLVDAVLLSAGAVSLFSFLKGYFPKGVDADKPPSGLSVETFGLEWRSASTHIVLLLSATCHPNYAQGAKLSLPAHQKRRMGGR